MITDEQLNQYRLDGTRLRIIRDASPKNDLKGIVVAWDEQDVIIRRGNRKLVKLSRQYTFQDVTEERMNPFIEE